MENIRIQIMLADEAYSHALAAALLRNDRRFAVTCEKTVELPKQDIYVREFDAERRAKSVYMAEKESLADRERHEYYKYANIRELAADMILAYADFSGRPVAPRLNNELEIIGVISSSGGRGCTSVSRAIAQELGRFHGKKVLYLPLEEFVSAGYREGAYGSREFMYYLSCDRLDKCSAADSFITADEYGVYSFNASRGRNPFHESEAGNIERCLETVRMYMNIDTAVMDIGSGAAEFSLAAMEMCRVLVMIRGTKDERFVEYLDMISQGALPGKMVFIENMTDEADEPIEETQDENLAEREKEITLPYDPPAVRSLNISLDTDFGDGIRDVRKALAGI